MPRAESQSASSSAQPAPFINLKRNQACHQCRKRKMLQFSDAQKPCSSCVKSHRFAVFGNPDLLLTEPECTYDNVTSEGISAKPRTKYQALEGRIHELESLLERQSKEKELLVTTAGPSGTQPSPLTTPVETPRGGHAPNSTNILDLLVFLPLEEFNTMSQSQTTEPLPGDAGQQLIVSGWPIRLPKPDLFYHLVDVFFTCYPHAHYLIHRPSFMLSLALSPKSLDFPHVSLLHAICAYAGVFSYLIEPPPAGDLEKIYRDFIFGDRRRPDSREMSFAEMHAEWAEEAVDQSTIMGFNMLECLQGSWAMCLDDQDIHQVLPGDLLHFEAGHDIQGTRQTLESPDLLLEHFPEHSDGLTLYIKATILVSKIKFFNLRIRFKHPKATDVRELPEFHQLEQKSFPQRYNNPIIQSGRGLDIHVYAAHLISQFATILLHDKHANLYSENCHSAQRIIVAARAILDLLYAISSTSYDITRLPPICVQCWGRSASVLIRLYKLEISKGNQEEALTIDLEIQSVRFAFNQIGTRLPMALKYEKALDFELETECSQIVRVYSLSQQGPSEPNDSPNVFLGNSARLEPSSNLAPSTSEATAIASALVELQSLFPDEATLPQGESSK
ncbi:unnamed protein product [Rhizoctonia solani]|uniref:Zn(2)-C6 fungal-type domain-containing protein n=1 Tax=Rhizoctonia solani TaxID=456999 RepID=A0A8H3A3G9_9AGAM|nr:unnamed protein product [Rhizoctonia solani]